MGEHDRNFKLLLRTFFREFLAAFTPDLSRELGTGRIEFCDKELVRPAGNAGATKVADLVARVRLRSSQGYILVHVEHQSRRERRIGLRLLSYASMLMEQTGLPVFPILVTSYDRPSTTEPESFVVDLLGRRVVDFRYRVVQLNRLDWRDYLQAKNPAATALMARMRIEPNDRIRVKAQVLRLILTMRLSRPKMSLIASFVDRYLALTAEEDLAMRRELATVLPMKLKEEASELMTSWERRGLEQGLEQGLEKGREEGRREERIAIVRHQLERRFGRLPQATLRRISRLSGTQLQRLTIALLDFGSAADLRSWLTSAAGSVRRAA